MRDLDLQTATHFARIALGHVTREYPHKLDHVLTNGEDCKSPRELHPIFYGSFDWHSCVHSYWLLVALLRRFPELPGANEIRQLVDRHFTAENVATEVAYLARPSARTFERPYGWGWLLKLAAELERFPNASSSWAARLAPLARAFGDRFLEFLPRATYPIRSGAHGNSAFAMVLALDWAAQVKDAALHAMIVEKASTWFENDSDCEAWEPSGDDFLSPTLVEAWLMRDVLSPRAFLPWLDRFLPHLEIGAPTTLFTPATVSDRSDGKIAHLDGLNLSRVCCWRRILRALPADDPRRPRINAAITSHLDASLPSIAGDYMGEHWLASFALLALTD